MFGGKPFKPNLMAEVRRLWIEEGLTTESIPGTKHFAAKQSGVVGRGQVVELVLEPPKSGPLTLILTLDQAGENDVWFASKESETPPQLLLATKPLP